VLALLKRPGGFVPLVISAGFLVAFAVGIARGTLVRQPDEDAGAHLFQILMPLQFVIAGLFAMSSFPKAPRPALVVSALQCCAALAVVAIVCLRHL
jgi:hypothetical protein